MSMPPPPEPSVNVTEVAQRSKRGFSKLPTALLMGGMILAGLCYIFYCLGIDLDGIPAIPWITLCAALLIAFGFEFANGFHDTANAVATVIYTRSMPPQAAVLWSGLFNFFGALVATGTVAYGIIALLPVELITQVGTGAGLAMVFALLLAAISWNIGTWYFGLPNSSSHTLVGSILGVGLANNFLETGRASIHGIDWGQAEKIGLSLLFSPIIGFIAAALLLIVMKVFIRAPSLNKVAQPDEKPPGYIRGLLILTCTGVSFAHGSNDGQKGMGLIMLILIGLVPAAFSLNPDSHTQDLVELQQASNHVAQMLEQYPYPPTTIDSPQKVVTETIKNHSWDIQATPALAEYLRSTSDELARYHSFSEIPHEEVAQIRTRLYLTGEALHLIEEGRVLAISPQDRQAVDAYQAAVNRSTQYIPSWVKVAVALALGLGTMVGWKRVVTTIGEKIGKDNLNYGQGVAAQTVTMATIGAADHLGLPASTTHVLSSAIAGSMSANGSGLQWATIRNMILAWIMTLPATILLSFILFIILRMVF
ncbi:Low-affinity inorganic phosphate transporter 1 [Halomonadaceae bacterium LMG 33818]|uniref:inorganic phosphate transporter n=1 Tax=Cernens ardua TaxID=3402176 RepID=UPI003EDBFFB3